jgi:hypothetical protein
MLRATATLALLLAVRPQAAKTTSRKNQTSWEGHRCVIRTPSAMSIWEKQAAGFPRMILLAAQLEAARGRPPAPC